MSGEYRTYATHTVQHWINNKHCWHLDTWFVCDQYENIGIIVREANGIGSEVRWQAWYLIWDAALGVWSRAPLHVSLSDGPDFTRLTLLEFGLVRTSQLLRNQELAVFNAYIRPLADNWPRDLYRRKSIAHHMIRVRYVNDPCEGLVNLYATTGRAQRDLARVDHSKLARRVLDAEHKANIAKSEL